MHVHVIEGLLVTFFHSQSVLCICNAYMSSLSLSTMHVKLINAYSLHDSCY